MPPETIDKPACKGPGLVPVIDKNRCEGKEDCVKVYPYDVFEMGTLSPAERSTLSPRGRIKAFFHRYRQAFVAHPEQCQSCGLCVTACPEKAIKLARSDPARVVRAINQTPL